MYVQLQSTVHELQVVVKDRNVVIENLLNNFSVLRLEMDRVKIDLAAQQRISCDEDTEDDVSSKNMDPTDLELAGSFDSSISSSSSSSSSSSLSSSHTNQTPNPGRQLSTLLFSIAVSQHLPTLPASNTDIAETVAGSSQDNDQLLENIPSHVLEVKECAFDYDMFVRYFIDYVAKDVQV
jgi:hypothetical protein